VTRRLGTRTGDDPMRSLTLALAGQPE